MEILVVNPNTTASMTAAIGRAAQRVAAPGTRIVAVNPESGPESIEGYYDEALSIPGLLAEIARGEARGVAGHVIACFDDTGLDAAREQNLVTYGLAARCARVRASDVPVLALEQRDADARRRIDAEIEAARREDRAEAVVLGCAGMADLAAELSARHALPVVEGVGAAVLLVEALARLGLATSKLGGYAFPLPKRIAEPVVRGAARGSA
jgi:allantoin racemase